MRVKYPLKIIERRMPPVRGTYFRYALCAMRYALHGGKEKYE